MLRHCPLSLSLLLLVLSGCGQKGDTQGGRADSGDTARSDSGPPPREVTVTLGDCSGPNALFESGMRPHTAQYTMAGNGGSFAALTGTGDLSSGVDDRDVYGGLLDNDTDAGVPGRGVPMKSGAGWGTIGVGKLQGRKNRAPAVIIGNTSAAGDLDKNIIRRYIRRKLPRIRVCYEKQLLVQPTLAGTIVTQFQITPTGKVEGVQARGMGAPEVESCVADAIASIRFPKPRGGGYVNVRYPFHFRVREDDAPAPSADAQQTAAPAPKKQPAPPADAAHVPGKESIFRGKEEELASCFRKQEKRRFGALVAQFRSDEKGAVGAVEIYGWGDSAVDECVAKLATASTHEAAQPQRCPVAFGPLSVWDLPGITVDRDAVLYAATASAEPSQLATVAPLAGDGPWQVQPLLDALKERRRGPSPGAPKRVIQINGPLVFRAVPETPMTVVHKLLRNAGAADVTLLLAAPEAGQWKLLPHAAAPKEDARYPLAPTPVGSGDERGVEGRELDELLEDVEPRASLLVGAQEIWLGGTVGLRLRVKLRDDRLDWDAAQKALRDLRAEPSLRRLRRIEIAVEGNLTYAEFATAARLAAEVGFDDWRLVEPNDLSLRFRE